MRVWLGETKSGSGGCWEMVGGSVIGPVEWS